MARETGDVQVQGRGLRCLICSHDVFWQQELQLSSPLLALFTMDEGSRAHCAVCDRCGYVHMFFPPAAKVETEAPAGGPVPDAAA